MRTSSRIEASATAIAFEVLGLLVRDENLQVIKITFAVVTPWALQLLVEVGIPLSLLGHLRGKG